MTAEPDQRIERSTRLSAALARARSGDTSALDEVVRDFNPLLWHVARSQGLNATEAADVVQTTWLELVGRLDVIRTPAALPGWLITVTKREAWRVSRRDRRLADAAEMAELPAPDVEVDGRLLSDERDHALWRCFRRLSDRCQALLRVVANVERPDYQQISEAMGMPVGSIGPTRGRCLAKLRELLLADPGWAT
jgi:RNA polymerase sigma factor (sigma-70 family)